MPHAKTSIATPLAPAAIGPYSQAVRVGGLVFTSGQVALDPATGALVSGNIREQTERVSGLPHPMPMRRAAPRLSFVVETLDLRHLNRLVDKLRRVQGVRDVQRIQKI